MKIYTFFVFIVLCLVSGVALCWYILILLTPNFPGCPGLSRSKLSLSRPLEREEGARSRTENRGEEGEEIIMAMTKMKSGIRSQVSKNRSGKLDYFCSHTVFLEAAAAVSQQGDLLLRQQFGLGHNITKLRRNYPPLIGLTGPFQNINKYSKVAGLFSPVAAWQGGVAWCSAIRPLPSDSIISPDVIY